MTLELLKRADKGSVSNPAFALTAAEHDTNLTAIELAVNALPRDGVTIYEASSVEDPLREFPSGGTFVLTPSERRHRIIKVGDAARPLTANMILDLNVANDAWTVGASVTVLKRDFSAFSVTVRGFNEVGTDTEVLTNRNDSLTAAFISSTNGIGPANNKFELAWRVSASGVGDPITKTAAAWTADAATILLVGQRGLESDTRLFKFGNGSDVWAGLSYSGGGPGDVTVQDLREWGSGTAVTVASSAGVITPVWATHFDNSQTVHLVRGAGDATAGPLLVRFPAFPGAGRAARTVQYEPTAATMATTPIEVAGVSYVNSDGVAVLSEPDGDPGVFARLNIEEGDPIIGADFTGATVASIAGDVITANSAASQEATATVSFTVPGSTIDGQRRIALPERASGALFGMEAKSLPTATALGVVQTTASYAGGNGGVSFPEGSQIGYFRDDSGALQTRGSAPDGTWVIDASGQPRSIARLAPTLTAEGLISANLTLSGAYSSLSTEAAEAAADGIKQKVWRCRHETPSTAIALTVPINLPAGFYLFRVPGDQTGPVTLALAGAGKINGQDDPVTMPRGFLFSAYCVNESGEAPTIVTSATLEEGQTRVVTLAAPATLNFEENNGAHVITNSNVTVPTTGLRLSGSVEFTASASFTFNSLSKTYAAGDMVSYVVVSPTVIILRKANPQEELI